MQSELFSLAFHCIAFKRWKSERIEQADNSYQTHVWQTAPRLIGVMTFGIPQKYSQNAPHCILLLHKYISFDGHFLPVFPKFIEFSSGPDIASCCPSRGMPCLQKCYRFIVAIVATLHKPPTEEALIKPTALKLPRLYHSLQVYAFCRHFTTSCS